MPSLFFRCSNNLYLRREKKEAIVVEKVRDLSVSGKVGPELSSEFRTMGVGVSLGGTVSSGISNWHPSLAAKRSNS